MRVVALGVVSLLLVSALAGCIASRTADVPAAPAATAALPVDEFGLLKGAPNVTAADTLKTLKEFTKAYPKRNSNNDAHNKAREYLKKQMEDAGLEVVMQELTAPVSPTSTPTGLVGGGRLVNVIGIKWGEQRDSWVVIGGHYDVTDLAVEGAYDDGSGTAMTVELAKAYSKVNTTRTIAFVLFDGEEQGLRGSDFFVKEYTEGRFQYNMSVFAMVDLDMFGINYPSDPVIVFDDNSLDVQNITRKLVAREGIPEKGIEYRGITAGRSDYGPFLKADIPVGFFISDFDDVKYRGQTIPKVGPLGTYPWWHRIDTVETMTEFAGGPAALEKSFQVAVDLANGLLWELSANPGLTLTLKEVKK